MSFTVIPNLSANSSNAVFDGANTVSDEVGLVKTGNNLLVQQQ